MSATPVEQYCFMCREDDLTVFAITWCTECESFLCKECEVHHQRSKASKQHTTISIQEYENLPDFVIKTNNTCPDHGQKYEFYCSFHKSPCCLKCVQDVHCGCEDLKQLSEITRDIKLSAPVSQLREDLHDLKEDLETIEKHFSNRIDDVEKQKENGLKKIHDVRMSLNYHLDEIEKNFLEKFNFEYLRIKANIKNLILQVETKTRHLEQIHSDLDNMVRYANNMQMYFGLNTIEKLKNEVQEYLDDLNAKDNLKDTDLLVTFSDAVIAFIDDRTKFGTVTSLVSDIPLHLKKIGNTKLDLLNPKTNLMLNPKPNLMLKPKIKYVDEIKPVLKKKFHVGKNTGITGCQILHDSCLLFVDAKNKALLLFNKIGLYVRHVFRFRDEPKDICQLKKETVVVTFPFVGNIDFINVQKNRKIKSIEVGEDCNGIDSNGKEIIVGLMGNSFLVLDIDGNILQRLHIEGEDLMRISLYKNNVCYSDSGDNNILCYSKAGDLLWTFAHPRINNPIGNASDSDGFMYIACRNNNKIVAFSPETKEMNVILSHNDGLDDPCAIHVDKKKSLLLVANLEDGFAFLFQL